MDWFEIGRQDGIQGLPEDHFLSYQQNCTDLAGTSNDRVYSAGYRSGLAEYCSWKSGVEIGRTGGKLPDVCPKVYHKRLALALQLGSKLSELTTLNQRLYLELNERNSRLLNSTLSESDRVKVRKEISELRSRQTANDKQLKELEGQVNSQVF